MPFGESRLQTECLALRFSALQAVAASRDGDSEASVTELKTMLEGLVAGDLPPKVVLAGEDVSSRWNNSAIVNVLELNALTALSGQVSPCVATMRRGCAESDRSPTRRPNGCYWRTLSWIRGH